MRGYDMASTKTAAPKALIDALERRRRRGRSAFGTVRILPSGRLQARYIGPDDQRYSAPRTYDTLTDADAYLRGVESDIGRGAWISPNTEDQQGALFGEYAQRWLRNRDLKPRTRAHYRALLDAQILPRFETTEIRTITPSTISAWHSTLDASKPTSRAHAYSLTRAILSTAVTDEILPANPCRVRGAGNAKTVHKIEPLTLDEATALVAAMPAKHRALTLLAIWCGLRFGEITELRRKDIDMTRDADGQLVTGVIHVRRAVARVFTEGHGTLVIGSPKSDAGIRDVAIPPHLLTVIDSHLREFVATDAESLLFPGAGGSHMAPSALVGKAPKTSKTKTGKTTVRVGHGFYAARVAAGRPDLRWHDLRHTGAVLAAQTGASLAELMARLGHSTSSAAMRYQHAALGRDAEIAVALSGLAMAEPHSKSGT